MILRAHFSTSFDAATGVGEKRRHRSVQMARASEERRDITMRKTKEKRRDRVICLNKHEMKLFQVVPMLLYTMRYSGTAVQRYSGTAAQRVQYDTSRVASVASMASSLGLRVLRLMLRVTSAQYDWI